MSKEPIIYLWSRSWIEDEDDDPGVWIWTEKYYKEHNCVSDQYTTYLGDGVWDDSFDDIKREIEDLGYYQVQESLWMGIMWDNPVNAKPIDDLIKYLQNHPRFKFCKEMDEGIGEILG